MAREAGSEQQPNPVSNSGSETRQTDPEGKTRIEGRLINVANSFFDIADELEKQGKPEKAKRLVKKAINLLLYLDSDNV